MSPSDFHIAPKIDCRRDVTRSSLSFRLPVALLSLGLSLTLLGCQSSPDGGEGDGRSRGRQLVDLNDRILGYAKQAGNRSSPYTPPSDAQRKRLAAGVGHLLDGDRKKAGELLGDAGFKVTGLTDTVSGRRYDEIAARKSGSSARWGRLYLNADAAVRWNVQVPHPVADRDTEALGARLLEGTPGGALVLAGAHRTAGRGDAADVAHRTDSVFHAFVTEMQKRGIPGVQLHGFAKSSKRPYEAILSTGAMQTAPAEATALADLMENRDLRVCRGWADRCPLEGKTNVQGKSAKRHQANFLHVELAPVARGEGTEATEAMKALASLLAGWSARGR
jgi:hypothetical protein